MAYRLHYCGPLGGLAVFLKAALDNHFIDEQIIDFTNNQSQK